MNPTGSAVTDNRRHRKLAAIVLLVFLLGVLVGFLLSPRCRQCLGGDAKVRGDQTSGTGNGPPSKISIGRGSGQGGGGSGQASGDTQGRSHNGDAQGVAGSASAGGGRGKGQTADGGSQQSQDASDPLRTAVLKRAQGLDGGAGDPGPDVAETPPGKLMSAPDFSYDRTTLPRYPKTQRVESALAYPRSDNTQRWKSSVGMTTPDSFDAVVAWYRAQLPAGWKLQSTGDMHQLAQQLSIQNITAALSAATGGSATQSSGTAAASSASDPANRVMVSIFEPTAATPGKPGVMVTQHGDQPVTIMLHASSP